MPNTFHTVATARAAIPARTSTAATTAVAPVTMSMFDPAYDICTGINPSTAA